MRDRGWQSSRPGEIAILAAGAAVAASTAVPRVFAQQPGNKGTGKFYEKGIWSLLKRAPDRVTAAVLAQPVGWRPEMRDPKYPGTFWKSSGAALNARRPEIATQTTDRFVTRMFETNPDFVFTVTRDFLPDEVPAHPYAVAMECAMLAPKAEVSIFPWKEPKERIPLAVRQIHSFLRRHQPA